MRYLLFAALIAAPTALITWVFTRGGACPRPEVVGRAAPSVAKDRTPAAASLAAPAAAQPASSSPPAAKAASAAVGAVRSAVLPAATSAASPPAGARAAAGPPRAVAATSPVSSPAQVAHADAPRPRITERRAALAAALAEPLAGARASGPVTYYDSKGLFDYIDGAAPLYVERGFVLLGAAEMKTARGHELTCDVYDMGSAAGARAIYAAEPSRQARAQSIGDEGRSSTLSLVFRQDRYYVKLTAFDADAEKSLPEVARALARRLP